MIIIYYPCVLYHTHTHIQQWKQEKTKQKFIIVVWPCGHEFLSRVKKREKEREKHKNCHFLLLLLFLLIFFYCAFIDNCIEPDFLICKFCNRQNGIPDEMRKRKMAENSSILNKIIITK